MLHCYACFREMRMYLKVCNMYIVSNCVCAFRLISHTQPYFLWHASLQALCENSWPADFKDTATLPASTTPQPSMYGIFCLHLGHFKGASIGTVYHESNYPCCAPIWWSTTQWMELQGILPTPSEATIISMQTAHNFEPGPNSEKKKTQLGCTWSSSSLAGFINIYKGRY